jgi:hypothetical protein
MNQINNAIYLRRRSKIGLRESVSAPALPLNYIASVLKNIEALGFTFSESLIHVCRTLSLEQLSELYQELLVDLQKAKGAHRRHQPMYPNFPDQVMEMSEGELYLNAIVHYVTAGRLRPLTATEERPPLLEVVELQVIDLGTQEEFLRLFGQIVSSNTSLSEQDKEDLRWFVATYGSDITGLLPEAIPQKENMAFVVGLLIEYVHDATDIVSRFCRTATDLLRLAVAMSGGDVSLATATKFRSFTRAERRLMLGLLNRCPNATEDMLRWKGRWIRLGERLHPREVAERYPQVAEAFRVLRNDIPFPTFNGQVETALARRDAKVAVAHLISRAGDFARRLDHLLRLEPAAQDAVIAAFAEVVDKVSTPVLLQVRQHFRRPNHALPIRVFFPKGSLAKAHAVTNVLPNLSGEVRDRIATLCEGALVARFRALPSLGKVYVGRELWGYMVPFASRSASKSFRTLARGSRLSYDHAGKVLRFFVWWKNGEDRTDIDLSATMFDAEFNYVDIVSYYNLKGYGGCHSGDIVDAPNGASEFIDITLDRVRKQRVRYVVMTLTSYTQQPYCDLPECFAGWMMRTKPGSGEIYEPKTVRDRLDITANSRIAIPLIFDVAAGEVIWCDMALRRNPRWQNHVHGNLKGINLTLEALTHLNKPNLYDLFTLHATARGELVASPELADTVFSAANGTPFRHEQIASEYLL